jgi:hypothetical protein
MNFKPFLTALVIAVSQTEGASPWKWEAEPDVEKYALAAQKDGVKVGIKKAGGVDRELSFTEASDERLIHTWKGHRFSSFAVTERFLYLVDYHPRVPGVRVQAIDRETGKISWKKELPQEPIPNSKFVNRTNIEVDGVRVRIFSQQSFRNGKFWWVINARDGKTMETNLN